MKKLWRCQKGFTLAEVLVGVSILTAVMSTVGMALFQALGTETRVVDDGLAISELRKGLGWFAGDIKMAKSTDLVDGAPAVSSATFSWTDEFQAAGTPHTISYAVVGDSLVRTYDGIAHTVTRRAVSASFSRSGQTITAQFEVDAGAGTTRILSVETFMRLTP